MSFFARFLSTLDYRFYQTRRESGLSYLFSSGRTDCSSQGAAPFDEVTHRQHRERSVVVLGQPSVTRLRKAPQPFDT